MWGWQSQEKWGTHLILIQHLFLHFQGFIFVVDLSEIKMSDPTDFYWGFEAIDMAIISLPLDYLGSPGYFHNGLQHEWQSLFNHILACGHFPSPKKKNSEINQRLTEKWNTLGVTKPLLTTPQWLFCPFCLILENDTISPKRSHTILLITTDSHTKSHAESFFLVTFKTDVSHPPTENSKERFHSPS